MAEEFKVLVGVEVSQSELDSLNSKIKNANIDAVTLELDTKSAENRIKHLKSQIKALNDIKVNLNVGSNGKSGGRGNANIDNTTLAYKELVKTIRQMGGLKKNIASLDVNKDAGQIKTLTTQLDSLQRKYDNIRQTFDQRFNVAQLVGLHEEMQKVDNSVDRMNAKIADSSNAKQAQSSIKDVTQLYKELASTASKIGETKIKIAGLDSDKNANEISALNDQLNKLTTEYNTLYSTFEKDLSIDQITHLDKIFENTSNKIAEINARSLDKGVLQQFKELSNMANKMDNLEIKIAGLDKIANANEISALQSQLESLRSTYRDLYADLKGKLSDEQLTQLAAKADETQNKIAQIEAKVQDAKQEFADSIKLKLDDGSFENDFADIFNDLSKLKTQSQELEQAMLDLTLAQNDMQLYGESGDIDNLVKSYEKYEQVLRKVRNLIDLEQKSGNTKKFDYEKQALDSDIQIWLKQNSAAAKQFGAQLDDIRVRLKNCDAVELDGLKAEFREVTKQATLAGKTGLSWTDQLKAQFKEYGMYLSASSMISYGIEGFRAMYENVVAVDTAMTGLYRVTDLTSNQYDALYDDMVKSAKEYGSTLADMITSTADWVRLGFDSSTANQLAEITAMYQHISDLDNETAVENLVTAYKGFQSQLSTLYAGDEAAAVQYIADIFNELDNNFAVTADNIGSALSKSASALSMAGNTIQETAAMVTGITEVTQDPEKAGSALKILSLRLRGMKGELQALGEETDENVESISKMQTQVLNLTEGKVNIFEDDGSFKSTYEIMDGIAEIYNSLDPTKQADLLETIAGKNRANDVAALINNWSQVEKAMTSAMNAEGSASEENTKYMDSIQGRLDALTASWQALSNTVINSAWVKGAVSGLTALVSVLDFVIDKFGTLILLFAGGFAFEAISGGGIKSISDIADVFILMGQHGKQALTMLSAGFTTLWGIISAHPIGAIITALAALAVTAGVAMSGILVSAEEANEAMDSEFAEFEEAKSKVESLNDELDATKKKIAELESKGGLTLVEKAELAKLKEYQKTLEMQQDIAEKNAQAEAKESNEATLFAYRKNFKHEISQAATDQYTQDVQFSGNNVGLISDSSNISAMIAGIKEFTKLRDEATDTEDWNHYNDIIDESTNSVWEQVSALSQYKENLESTDYKGEELKQITDQIDYIYKELDPTTWKQWKLDEIMDNDVFADAKQNLIDIAKASDNVGVSVQDVANESQYLYKVLSDFDASNGTNLLQDFVDSINSQAGIVDFDKIRSNLKTSFTEGMSDVANNIIAKFNIGKISGEQMENQLEEVESKVEEFNDWINDLSEEDLELVYQISLDADTSNFELNDWISALEHYKVNTINVPVNIESEISGLETVSSAIEASASSTGLLEENVISLTNRYSELESFDPESLFINTASGVKLNTSELQRLESVQQRIVDQEFEDTILAEEQELQRLRQRTKELTDADEDQRKELENLIETQEDKIASLKQLRSMYQGLTSDYAKMLQAQETENAGSMYDNIKEAYTSAKDLFKQGLIGTDDFTSFVELMTFEDMSLKTPQQMAEIFRGFSKDIPGLSYSISDFFAEGNKGAENFLKACQQVDEKWASFDGKSWKFDFGDTPEETAELAKALGVSVEFIEAMAGKLADFGFHIDWDKNVDTLDDLKYKVQETEAAVTALGQTPFKIDCDTSSVESIQSELVEIKTKADEIKNSDLSPEVKDAQLADLAAKYQMLLMLIDEVNATETKTNIDTSTVDGAMQAATQAINEYNSAKREAEARSQLGLDTTEAEAKMTSVATKLSEIDNTEVKAKLGIEETDNVDSIKGKLESDTITIPTDVEKPSTAEIIGEIESKEATITVKAEGKEEIEALKEAIQGVVNLGNTNVTVSARVVGDKEADKLRQAIEQVENKSVSVTADVSGDTEAKTLSDSIKVIKGKNVKVNAAVEGATQAKTLSDSIDKVKGKNVQVKANVKGEDDATELASSIQSIEGKSVDIAVTSSGAEEVKAISDSLAGVKSKTALVSITTLGRAAINSIKTAFDTLKNKTVTLTATAVGSSMVQQLKSAIESVKDKTVKVSANVSGTSSVWSLANAINSVSSKTVTITAKTDGLAALQTMKAYYDSLVDKTVTVTMQTKGGGGGKFVDGTAHHKGSAFAGGTAYSRGDWRIGYNGTSLGGELGAELLVRDGRWTLIGKDSAGFFTHKAGDIVFNALQTEQILKYGKITSGKKRGTSYAEGSANTPSGFAFVSGSGSFINGSSGSGTSTSNSGTSDSNYDYSKDFKEVVDWIEVLLDRFDRAIESLDAAATSVYKTFSVRDNSLTQEIAKITEQIKNQEAGYKRYLQEANAVGLSSSWAKKVRDGVIDIDVIYDEDLAEQISDYTDWYNKALDCKYAVDELNESLSECYEMAFDNVVTQYEGILAVIEHERNLLDEYIAQSEAKGWVTSANYFTALIANELENIEILKDQRAAMITEMNQAVNSGAIAKNSEAYAEMVGQIDDVTLAIEESNTAVLEYQNSIREVEWEVFDLLREKIEGVTDELSFLSDLFANDKLFDDRGQLTNAGQTAIGLHGISYNTYMAEADEYAKELIAIDKDLAQNPYDQELLERRQDLLEAQQDCINAAEEEKQAIISMVTEGIELEIGAMQELIAEYSNALDSQKD